MIPIAICLHILLSIPRVDSVTVEGLQLPDPGKGQQVLVGFGRYTVADGWRISSIRLCAQNTATPRQCVKVYAAHNDRGEWQAKLPLAAGEYHCWVEMTTTDEPGDPREARRGILTLTKRVPVRVK
jgi:hypothetical protein